MSQPAAAEPADVVFLINSLEGGGAERIVALLLHQFEALRAAGENLQVRLALLDDTPFAYPIPPNTGVSVLAAAGAFVPSVKKLHRYLRPQKPAIVVSHLTRANLAAVLCCRWLRIPVIIMEHVNTTHHFGDAGLRARISMLLVRLLYGRADRIIAVSQGVADDLVENFNVSRRLVEVIPTPFDLDRIRRLADAAPEKPLPEDFVVAVGRLTANKNFSLLLRAYAQARIASELVILGDGEDAEELAQEARALGIQDRITFLGFVSNPYAVMRRARAFVSSSNVEGFPVAPGEAMALGRPVLMTDCPSGPAELLGGNAPPGAGVVRGTFGLLVPVNDVQALAAGLVAVVQPDVVAVAEAGRERMETFRPDAVARRHAALVHAVLLERRGASR